MSGCKPEALGDILAQLPDILPRERRGLSARDVQQAIATWAPSTVRTALTVFERDGHAVSELAPGGRNQPTRYYRLANSGVVQ